MELLLDDVTVRVHGRALVSELGLTVGSGEVVGLIGPNGSGKSTALRCVYRALAPSGGVVRVGGEDITQMSLRENARRVAALTQETQADFDFTVAEVVALGRTPFKRGNEPLTPAEREMCSDAMAATDILHLARRGILSLSGGERQRVLIARALVQDPQVLVLDEPTNHLDIRHQVAILGRLRSAVSVGPLASLPAPGPTTVVVLHDLNLAAAVCDRLAVLDGGRLVRVGPPAEVLTESLIADVFGVDVSVLPHPLTGRPQVLFTLPGPQTPVPGSETLSDNESE